MKRTLAAVLTLAFMPALLTGCGSKTNNNTAAPEQTAQQEQSDTRTYTPEEIRENNSAKNLLARHTAMTYTRTFTDHEGNVSGTTCEQYTMADGLLQTQSAYTDETGNVVYTQQGYADKTYTGATYGLASSGEKYMTLYPDNETYESMVDTWLATADENSITEKVTDTTMQDGAVIVTVRTDYRDEADLYEMTDYRVDPETDDLLYMKTTSYNTQDDSVVAVVTTEISYDKPITFDAKPFETIIADSDYCEVSLIVDPQQDDMTVCSYPIAHGTLLSFVPISDYTLYSDEGLTQKIADDTSIDISGEACNIFAVPQKG